MREARVPTQVVFFYSLEKLSFPTFFLYAILICRKREMERKKSGE